MNALLIAILNFWVSKQMHKQLRSQKKKRALKMSKKVLINQCFVNVVLTGMYLPSLYPSAFNLL